MWGKKSSFSWDGHTLQYLTENLSSKDWTDVMTEIGRFSEYDGYSMIK